MKILEYLFAIILIGAILLCCVPICVYGLIMAVIDNAKKNKLS